MRIRLWKEHSYILHIALLACELNETYIYLSNIILSNENYVLKSFTAIKRIVRNNKHIDYG